MSNVGQVALTIVGAVVGFIYGGPYGAVYGASLGGLVGSAAFPTQLPPITGPRLQDNKVTATQVGSPVAEVFGVDVVSGTVIWLGPTTEIATTEEVGGKGGAEQSVTTYTYTQSIAVGLCRGPIGQITRIWENGKLVLDRRAQQPGETLAAAQQRYTDSANWIVDNSNGMDIYLGDTEQLPNPEIESHKGAGNVPPFRGLAYVIWYDKLLREDQGLRHPNFKFEISEDPVQGPF